MTGTGIVGGMILHKGILSPKKDQMQDGDTSNE